jgi:hypothetical protein
VDHQRDFEPFKRLVSRLCVTFDKFASEELVESWWKALRMEPFKSIERNVDAFIAKADDKTKFPKPGQFSGSIGMDLRDSRIDELNVRHWRSFIADHPKTGPIRMKLAAAARVIATTQESSPAHAEAQAEYLALEKMLGAHGRFSADC